MTASALMLSLSLTLGQAYCPDGSCGIGLGAGVQIGRIDIGGRLGIQRQPRDPNNPHGLGRRPQSEPLFLLGMARINGGLGIHVGDNMILTCTHGDKSEVTYEGSVHRPTILAEIPREDADVSVLYVPSASFQHVALIADANPPPGTRVSWQGGGGIIVQHVGNYSWVQGRCRLGDSGSPVMASGRIVGVISGANSTHTNIGNVAGIHLAMAQARANHPGLQQPESQPQPKQEPLPRLIESPDDGKEVIPDRPPLSPSDEEMQGKVERELDRREDIRRRLERLQSEADRPSEETPPDADRSRDASGDGASPLGALAAPTTDWGQLGATAAMWALGAAGLGGGAVSGAWVIYGGLAAAKILAGRLRRKRKTTSPASPQPVADGANLERQLTECREARIAQEADARRLRDALSAAQRDGGSSSSELSELRRQLEISRTRITELEQRHRELVVAYRDSYKEAVDLAEAALHRKDPQRWQNFIPAWRSMVDQFHSAIREERKHASNSPVHI